MVTTKSQLLQSQCFTRAEDEEPTFLLVGHDAVAADAVKFWAMARKFARSDDMEAVGQAFNDADAFRTWYSEYLKRNPDKRRNLPYDITIWLNVFQQFMEDVIGMNDNLAENDPHKFDPEMLKNAKRALHRVYAAAMQIEQDR